MPILHKLSYKRLSDTRASIEIDDRPIKCYRFSFDHDAQSIPYAEIEVYGSADIKTMAEIGLRVNISDVYSAINCLKMAYQLDDKFKRQAEEYIKMALVMDDAHAVIEKLLGDTDADT